MKRKRGIRSTDRHSRRLAANRPSTYIRPFSTIHPSSKVVLWCRVSSGLQNTNGNNNDQEAELRAAVQARGGIVVGVESFAGRFYDADAWLYKAANHAAKAGAVLLAESTSRFARHPNYHPKLRPHLVAGAIELRNLQWVCGNVTLVTLHHPDTTWQEERSYQSKRGQQRKGNHGGRPRSHKPGYKKQRRLQALPKVRWMKSVGMSNRAIARALGTDEKNVRQWAAAIFGRGREDERG